MKTSHSRMASLSTCHLRSTSSSLHMASRSASWLQVHNEVEGSSALDMVFDNFPSAATWQDTVLFSQATASKHFFKFKSKLQKED